MFNKSAILMLALTGLNFVQDFQHAFAAEGDSLWCRTFGGADADYAFSVLELADGNLLLAGATCSFGCGNWDAWLLKTDSCGDSIWSATFGGDGEEHVFSLVETATGDLLLSGWTDSFGAGLADMWLVAADSTGDSLWSQTFGGSDCDYAFAFTKTSTQEYLLVGSNSSVTMANPNIWMVKTDSTGDSLWSCLFGGNEWEAAYSVTETAAGDYLLAGYTESYGADGFDMWLLKTTSDGDSVWARTFGGDGNDEARCVIENGDGCYLLAGYTSSFGAGGDDIWLLKTSADGDSLWSHTFGGPEDDYACSVIETSQGCYLLTGYTSSFGAGGCDVWVLKTDPDGNLLWSETFGGTGNDYGYSSIETSEGNYVLAGETHSSGAGFWDMWLICLEGCGSAVSPSTSVQPYRFACHPPFPNPFNPATTITFTLPLSSQVSLAIYDLMGCQVALLIDADLKPGIHEIIFNTSHLASGIYIYRLTAGDYTAARKMVLMK